MSAPTTYTLKEPIQFGSQPITELVLKPTAKAFRGFSLPMTEDGRVFFQPYELAEVAVRMAGHPAVVTEMLSAEDMAAVAGIVMGFLEPGPGTGSTPSP